MGSIASTCTALPGTGSSRNTKVVPGGCSEPSIGPLTMRVSGCATRGGGAGGGDGGSGGDGGGL